MKLNTLLAAAGLLLAPFAPAAHATDGVVLLNQATSINGLPGCAANPAALVTICQPGSYRLAGNLQLGAKALGVLIQADNVSLDLNGFAITGPGAASATECISTLGPSGNPAGAHHQIANGVVADCGFGVHLNSAATVRNLIAADCNIGVGVALDGLVEDTTVESAARYGIELSTGSVLRCRIVGGTPLYGVVAHNNALVLQSEIAQASSALLGEISIAYGLNLFHDITHISGGIPLPEVNGGGVSMGNNVCSNFQKC